MSNIEDRLGFFTSIGDRVNNSNLMGTQRNSNQNASGGTVPPSPWKEHNPEGRKLRKPVGQEMYDKRICRAAKRNTPDLNLYGRVGKILENGSIKADMKFKGEKRDFLRALWLGGEIEIAPPSGTLVFSCKKDETPQSHTVTFEVADGANIEYGKTVSIGQVPTWTTATTGTSISVTVAANEFLFMRGMNTADSCPVQFTSTTCSVYGSVIALFDHTVSAEEQKSYVLPESACEAMFYGCTTLKDAYLILPSTVTSDSCYYQMFEGCTSLVNVPALFATEIADDAYGRMFAGCTSLTRFELPAVSGTTSVGDSGCAFMFHGCTALTYIPESFAVSSASDNAFESMFEGCINIRKAPTFYATTYGDMACKKIYKGCTSLESVTFSPFVSCGSNAFQQMCEGCTSLVTFKSTEADNKVSLASIPIYAFYQAFKGCTALTSVPQMVAATIEECGMKECFYGCTSLASYPDFTATTTLGINALEGIFRSSGIVSAPNFAALTQVGEKGLFMAFKDCTALTQYPTLSNIRTVGSYGLAQCFEGCTSLRTHPTFPSVNTLGTYAFSKIFSGAALSNYNFSFPSLLTIGANAFEKFGYDTTISSLTLNFPIATTVGDCAFSYAFASSHLDDPVINFPSLIASNVGSEAFYGMFEGSNVQYLDKVYIKVNGNLTANSQFDSFAYSCALLLTGANISIDGITGSGVFENCYGESNKIESVTFSGTASYDYSEAFAGDNPMLGKMLVYGVNDVTNSGTLGKWAPMPNSTTRCLCFLNTTESAITVKFNGHTDDHVENTVYSTDGTTWTDAADNVSFSVAAGAKGWVKPKTDAFARFNFKSQNNVFDIVRGYIRPNVEVRCLFQSCTATDINIELEHTVQRDMAALLGGLVCPTVDIHTPRPILCNNPTWYYGGCTISTSAPRLIRLAGTGTINFPAFVKCNIANSPKFEIAEGAVLNLGSMPENVVKIKVMDFGDVWCTQIPANYGNDVCTHWTMKSKKCSGYPNYHNANRSAQQYLDFTFDGNTFEFNNLTMQWIGGNHLKQVIFRFTSLPTDLAIAQATINNWRSVFTAGLGWGWATANAVFKTNYKDIAGLDWSGWPSNISVQSL